MNLSPTRETFGSGDQTWLGSAHGTDNAQSITLDLSAFTAGTHYPNGFLPSGLPLTELGSGLYGPATGPADLAGFLFTDVAVSGTADPHGAILEHCRVIADNLPVDVEDIVDGWFTRSIPAAEEA